MSYQFEDDSALEELLNQQLDRRRQRPLLKAQPSVTSSVAQKSPSIPSARPSTAILARRTSPDEPDIQSSTRPQSGAASKSKLASWLETKSPKQPTSVDTHPTILNERSGRLASITLENVSDARPKDSTPIQAGEEQIKQLLNESLVEERLQEMSKQRLIQLIVDQVRPIVESLHEIAKQHSDGEFDRLKAELQTEKARLELIETRHTERIKLEEEKWSQMSKQLEARVEFNERELARTIEGQREHLGKVDEQHQKNLSKLIEGYEAKLGFEKRQFEDELRRRDEVHQLELESKLRINCDLIKLETIHDEWKLMVESTIKELEGQFKSIKALIKDQTGQVNGTNMDLASKTKHLSDQFDKLEQRNQRMSQLADQMSSSLPQFLQIQEQSESIMGQINNRLDEFVKQIEQIRIKEVEIEETKNELQIQKDKLNEERFKVALDSSRVSYKEQRLDELTRSNQERELRLDRQKQDQNERETHLQATRTSLDIEAGQLREQNYDLHLLRRQLTVEKEDVARAQLDVSEARKSLRNRLQQLVDEEKRFTNLKERTSKELEQLRRLQKSLVCSLCLNRLFTNNIQNETVEHQHQCKMSNNIDCNGSHLGQMMPATGIIKPYSMDLTDLDNLTKMKQRNAEEAQRLASESKYVDLLSVTS